MKSDLLHMDCVSKTYPGQGAKTAVLSEFCLGIRPGESLGLSGPSGSGKSTIAKIIMGVESPDSGQLFFEDRLVSNSKKRPGRLFYRKAQMVWQDPFVYLNPFLPVRTSIIEPMAAFGIDSMQDRQNRADELMQAMGLDPALGSCRPGMLSGGQCQRAAIARALSVSPDLLICDEVLCGLDLPLQVDIMEHLTSIREKNNMALLFISHDRDCTARMCTRVITSCI
ncbi:MAG: dipeptide/oligopeptide/nickel ABC transporter ATP-binding protein [Proteobacteria bacterium]|nr:dipeptide/oligopeptide/nickel ABC transporter ATP-binding protein [Pseudomonadota bacterium]